MCVCVHVCVYSCIDSVYVRVIVHSNFLQRSSKVKSLEPLIHKRVIKTKSILSESRYMDSQTTMMDDA